MNKQFQGKVRTRVVGLLENKDQILLLKHDGLGGGFAWLPPGGQVEFGATLQKNLEREFLEEANIKIEVGDFLFVYEHQDTQGHHAIELFFRVFCLSGEIKLGFDPELFAKNQILVDINYFSIREIEKMHASNKHYVFTKVDSLEELFDLRGLVTQLT